MKNIRQKTVDLHSLKLSPEEGFVLSRIEGATSVQELMALTGFEEGRVVEIVGRLASEGALEVEGAGGGAVAPAEAHEQDDETALTQEQEQEQEPGEVDDPEVVEREQLNERSYREIYAKVFQTMTRDARVAAAADADGPHLMALCLDPEPQVIHAIFTNPRTGFDQARFAAQHHRTAAGLDSIAKRSELVADAMVQRRLLRNPQLPTTILQKIANPKMLIDVYKIGVDREIPERSRVMVRDILRKKFMTASSEEKAALLVKTEGRVLILLVNCSLDSHATQILCSKSMYTPLFIQNLARWSATPPALLSHLLKQPFVSRNLGMKKMLLKHPNTPSDAKRRG